MIYTAIAWFWVLTKEIEYIWLLYSHRPRCLFQLFSDNLVVDLHFVKLQDKHNIHILSLNIRLICTRCETGCTYLAFLHVSKARTHKLYIFRQCTYMYIVNVFSTLCVQKQSYLVQWKIFKLHKLIRGWGYIWWQW